MINIEITYALPDKYYLKKLQVEEGTIIQAAIFQSGILQEFTEIDLRQNKVGIFSRPAKLTDTVNEGDRIEIYRPLLADPKEIRRKRAEQQQKELEEQKKAEKLAKKLAKQTALSSQHSFPHNNRSHQ